MKAVELARRVREAGLDVPVVLLAYDAATSRRSDGDDAGPGAGLPLAGGREDPPGHRQVRRRQAERRPRHPRRRRPGHPARRGQRPLLLVLPAGDLRRAAPPLAAPRGRGENLSQKILRMRARPKILLCSTFEEAWAAYDAYREDLLGLISDIEFPEGRRPGPRGRAWSSPGACSGRWPDVPILLQSSRPENEARGARRGRGLPRQGLAHAPQRSARFMLENFGFGDFVFRLPDGTEVGRAEDLRDLEDKLQTVPAESIAFHAERNHFSKWLKARTEFALAHELRPRTLSDYDGVGGLRRSLIDSIADYRRELNQAVVADFDRETFDATGDFTGSAAAPSAGRRAAWPSSGILLGDSGLARPLPGRGGLGSRRRWSSPPTPSTASWTRTISATFALPPTTTTRSSRASWRRPFPRRPRRTCGRSSAQVRIPWPSDPRASSRTPSTSPSAACTRRSCCPTTTPPSRCASTHLVAGRQAGLRLDVLAAAPRPTCARRPTASRKRRWRSSSSGSWARPTATASIPTSRAWRAPTTSTRRSP